MNRKDDSMSRKSKNYSPEFRAKIAEAAIRGDKTINEVAKQFGVSPQMVLKMKARLKERMVELFQDGRSRKKRDEREVNHEELFEEIGRLKVENDWLKKKSAQFG
jgi:transposase